MKPALAVAALVIGTVAAMVAVAVIDILVFEEQSDPNREQWTDRNRWER